MTSSTTASGQRKTVGARRAHARTIEALLALREEHNLDASTIGRIELAYMIMIESEGITEEVTRWRTDVVAQIARELGLQNVMFEAADPEVFGWYVKNYGPEVNLFVDHSQIVQLECLRRGIWGTKSLWGRVSTYPEH